MKKVIVLYVPVLHEGYKRFFDNHKDATELFIFGPEIINEFDYLSKEIRALDPKIILKSIKAWNVFSKITILKITDLEKLNKPEVNIIMPDEDVTRQLSDKYLKKANIIYDQLFLRWNKHNATVEKPVDVDQEISVKDFDKTVIKNVIQKSKSSSDWWRQVGAAIVKDKKIVLVNYNKHVPSQLTPYTNGDPRNCFHKGDNIELSSALHAEAGLVAEAAKKGISLKGTSLYVSTFPCPPCAKLIAYSGIKKLYYTGGYGVLDGEMILKANKVKIIFVDINDQP